MHAICLNKLMMVLQLFFQDGHVCFKVSYPRILVKSNSNEFWTSPKSSPELLSNKSLCQGSRYVLFYYYRHFIYIIVFHNSCTLVAPIPSTMNSLFSIVTLYLSQTSLVTCSPFYSFVYSFTCHILEIWLSPTPKISGQLQCQLWSCIVTSLYARKVISL